MARLKVRYNATDPYYSDQVQTFIGIDANDCLSQMYEFEEWLGREHSCGISLIYKIEIIEECY